MKNPKVIEEHADSSTVNMVVEHSEGYGVIIEFKDGSRTEMFATSFAQAREMAKSMIVEE